MVVAGLLGDFAFDQITRALQIEHENQRFKQAGVHPAADTGARAIEQRHHDAECEQITGGQIADRNADAHRAVFLKAGDRHESRHALRDLIDAAAFAVGAGLTETADAAVDHARIHLVHVFPRHFEAVFEW